MSGFSYRKGLLFCEETPAADIVQAVGTPVYVYSRAALVERYRAIDEAFGAIEHIICFSVKSCSSLGILAVLRAEGCSFDVVSGGELFRVLAAGGKAEKVVYAGVGKTDAEIRFALKNGILMFNVESEAELANIDRLAAEMQTTAAVALRLNPDVDPRTHKHTTTGKKENKFGLDLKIASQLVKRFDAFPHLRLEGVHIHIGSPVNSVEPYAQAIAKAVEFVKKHESPQRPLRYLNTGGGFGLVYHHENTPSFEAYAEAIIPPVKKSGRILILEPGRSIVGNAAALLTQAQYRKWNGSKTFIIVDAGMNDLIRPAFYDSYHRIWPAELSPPLPGEGEIAAVAHGCPREHLETVEIVGPICESSDCFAKDRLLPKVERGQTLAIFSAGAYGFSMSSNYNSRPRPAEVLVDGRSWRIIRQRETWEDLVRGEVM